MNNLFKFVPNELSQGAFICWCANWVNNIKENRILYKMGMDFMNLLSDSMDVKSVEVYRQINGIDALFIVNKTTAIIVEEMPFVSKDDNTSISGMKD